jgi:hypothetical protein
MSKRNIYASFLLNLSDQNCSTFLGRAFANKSSFDTGRNIMQDVITGSTAAAANASPPAAAGLSLANLIIGKSVDNVNSTFYFEKTFQALAAAIGWQRELVLVDIEKMKTEQYDIRPIYDILAAVRKYDDACSIRVGLAKLQELAQEVKQNKKDTIDAQNELTKKTADLETGKNSIASLTIEVARLNRKFEDADLLSQAQPEPTTKARFNLLSSARPKPALAQIAGATSPDLKAKKTQAGTISNKSDKQVNQGADLKSAPTR